MCKAKIKKKLSLYKEISLTKNFISSNYTTFKTVYLILQTKKVSYVDNLKK